MNELYHHGVKGMKWGVRKKREPANLTENDRIVLKKSSKVQRISKTDSESNTGRTYISFTKLDNLQYEVEAGEGGLYWTSNYDSNNPNNPRKTNFGYKVTLKVTDDVIAPSYNETVNAFIKTVENISVKDLATRIYGFKEDQKTPNDKKEYKQKTKQFIKDMSKLSVKECRDQAYKAYSQSLMKSPENQKEFFNELKRRGYNAVVDHNDARDGNFNTPLIVFERSKNLKQISATPITDRDKEKASFELDKLY